MGRRRARSTRASPASIRWRFAAAAAFVVGSGVGCRRARLRRASPVSLRWLFYRCARCRGLQ
eukprot:scaffold76724_cov36-Phaeocystis_antarctica.AAC.1